MAKKQETKTEVPWQSSDLQFYVCEQKEREPLFILSTSQDRAIDAAKWFFGGLPVVGAAKGIPPVGSKIVVEVEPREDKPDHSGFVTRTFSK